MPTQVVVHARGDGGLGLYDLAPFISRAKHSRLELQQIFPPDRVAADPTLGMSTRDLSYCTTGLLASSPVYARLLARSSRAASRRAHA
eukprot:1375206-Pyramimonas_sp.AAC.1